MRTICQAARGTGPVTNNAVFSVTKAITGKQIMKYGESNDDLKNDFVVNGVTQTYDIFFLEHKGRRFRTLQGEYPYVRLSVGDWLPLEDADLHENDAVVLTYPFYGHGGEPRHLKAILDRCLELRVPVMIDAAYFGTCYGVAFDYSHPAIEMLSFSLSKTFSIQSYRAGVLFMKRPLGYLEEIQIAAGYFNKVGAYVGLELMQKFPANFMPTTYRDAHQGICQELDLVPSHCIMLGNVKPGDTRFDAILADPRFEDQALPEGELRRVCISAYISDEDPPLKKFAKKLLGR